MPRIVLLWLWLVPLSAFAQAPGPADVERVTLRDALSRALHRNPSVLVAMEEVRRATAIIEQVRAASLPNLSVNASYTRLDSDRRLGGSVLAAANQFGGNLNLSVPLVAPQRWTQWLQARDNRAVAEVSAAEARRQVAIATARAYLTLITLRHNIEVLVRARDTARAHLNFSQARLTGGIGNRLDVARAAQELSSDESQVQAAYGQQARAREALGVLIAAEAPVDTADEAPLPESPPLAQSLAESQERRTDVRAQRVRVAAAERVVRESWADYMPLLLGVFQPAGWMAWDQNGNRVDPPSATVPSLSWQASLLFSLPIYEGGLRYGLRHERVALSREAQESLVGLLRQARSDVRAGFDSVRQADLALGAAREAAQQANEALRLANLAYRAGATTNLEVIAAERAARDAESTAEAAADAARNARLDLLVASGRFP